jgi:hypothetical protein
MITKVIKPDWIISSNKTQAKKPAKIGIPAIDKSDPVKIAANNGLVSSKPWKLVISSFSLLYKTYKTTLKAAIPAKHKPIK